MLQQCLPLTIDWRRHCIHTLCTCHLNGQFPYEARLSSCPLIFSPLVINLLHHLVASQISHLLSSSHQVFHSWWALCLVHTSLDPPVSIMFMLPVSKPSQFTIP